VVAARDQVSAAVDRHRACRIGQVRREEKGRHDYARGGIERRGERRQMPPGLRSLHPRASQ
jgi:hypothetical protein